MSFLIDTLWFVVEGRHHCGDMEYNLRDSVPPSIGVSTIHVGNPIETLGVEAGVSEKDFSAETREKIFIDTATRSIGENAGFGSLLPAYVYHASFVAINSVVAIKADYGPLYDLLVWQEDWLQRNWDRSYGEAQLKKDVLRKNLHSRIRAGVRTDA